MNTKEKLMQLLELCIEKKINFDYSPKHGIVRATKFNNISKIIFNAETWDLDSKDINHASNELNRIIKDVKNYQS